jgi:hypothetical protein
MGRALKLDTTGSVPLLIGPEWDDVLPDPLPTDDEAIDAWLMEGLGGRTILEVAAPPVPVPPELDEDLLREIAEHQAHLERDRAHLASYRALKHLYLLTGQTERALLCSCVLELLNHGDPEDARVVAEYRRRPFATARRSFDEQAWGLLSHPDELAAIGRLSVLVGDLVAAVQAVPRRELGLQREQALDAADPRSCNKALRYVAATLGVPLPEAHVRPEQTAPVVVVNCRDDERLTPVVLLGQPIIGERCSRHVQVFELARALSQLRPERRLGLATPPVIAHTIAATWAIAAECEGEPPAGAAIGRTVALFRRVLPAVAMVQVESIGLELRDRELVPEQAAQLWSRGAELTGLRAGWALTGDLETCAKIVATSPQTPGSPPVKQRLLDLLWSSTTEPLIAVRKRLGLF